MYYYRITKYNPNFRDEKGRYVKNDWSCFSDVGKTFEDGALTLDGYESVEVLYIEAILSFVKCMNIPYLECKDVEKDDEIEAVSKDESFVYKQVKNNSKVNLKNLPVLLKLILRNYLWCRLVYGEQMFVHFGYDYYMYVGVAEGCEKVIKQIEASGLFVEEFVSPYLNED